MHNPNNRIEEDSEYDVARFENEGGPPAIECHLPLYPGYQGDSGDEHDEQHHRMSHRDW